VTCEVHLEALAILEGDAVIHRFSRKRANA
jgi:hypothetical protein